MNRNVLGLIVASCAIGSGCAFGVVEGEGCRITDIGADARRDENGNQVSIYAFRFFDRCQQAQVNASYNMGTQEAQEKLERPGMRATASWKCDSDPWISQGVDCTRISMNFAGTVQPSALDLANLDKATSPISSYPLVQIDRDTLKGQLGNASRRLEAPATKPAPAPAPAPNPNAGRFPLATLSVGASGPRVEALQLLLRNVGFEVAIDGDFGLQTEGVVRQFQRQIGQQETGTVNSATWVPLLVPGLAKGDQGDAVLAVQTLLNAQGHEVAVDGDFGDQTEGALRAFQGAHAIEADGKVGYLTWTALLAQFT